MACSFSASASSAEISKAQRRLAANPRIQSGTASPEESLASGQQVILVDKKPAEPIPLNEAHALLFFAFGIVCIVGSYQSFTSGHWPIYMPPQLDLFAVPISWLSEQVGAVVGGILACLIGVFSVIGSISIFLSQSKPTPAIDVHVLDYPRPPSAHAKPDA